MPLEDGYKVERFMEGLSFTIADAISGYIKDDIPKDRDVCQNVQFVLLLVDRGTGYTKYISDIKDNQAVIEMLKRIMGQREEKESLLHKAQEVAPAKVEAEPPTIEGVDEILTEEELQTKPNKETIN